MSVDTQAGACPHSCTYGDGLTLVDSRRWCEELHALNADLLWPGALAPLERRSTASPAERADLPAATPPDYSRGDPGAGG